MSDTKETEFKNENKSKILVIPLNNSAWGGSEVLWTNLALLWNSMGINVDVCVRSRIQLAREIQNLEDHGIRLHHYPVKLSKKQRFIRRFLRLLFKKTILDTDLTQIVSRLKPDLIVFSADCLGGLPGIKLSAACNIPYAYIMQANSESWWPTDSQRSEMISAIDSAKGAIFFVSEENKKLFEFQLGRRLDNSIIVRNPHGALDKNALPWEEPVSDNNQHILKMAFVGRLEPIAKGQDIIFQVLSMPQWKRRNWHLSLFGNGHGTEGVKALAEMLNISNRLSFVPAYSSLEDVWRNNHVLVMCSRYEGLPLALAEAMWLGRPAVVSSVADCPLLVRDGVDGFVASAAAVAPYAEAMERLWNNREQLPAMGRSAAKRVREFFPNDPVKEASIKILSILQD